jgi:hypothetical protein
MPAGPSMAARDGSSRGSLERRRPPGPVVFRERQDIHGDRAGRLQRPRLECPLAAIAAIGRDNVRRQDLIGQKVDVRASTRRACERGDPPHMRYCDARRSGFATGRSLTS